MAPDPLVSIIIPTYNQESFIETAVRSALAQDYSPLEVVVTDDSSADRTAQIVGSITDSRLRLERSVQNLGRVGNYRRGLYELARGQWVLNLDGDDFLIDPGFVSAGMRAAAAFPDASLVVGDRYERDEPVDQAFMKVGRAGSVEATSCDGTGYVLSLPRREFHMHHVSTLYKRTEALDIGFYRADIRSSDLESLYRLALGRAIVHIPAPVAVWRRHPSNASRTLGHMQAVENYRLFQGVHDFAVEKLGALRCRDFDQWLIRTVENRYYGNILSYVRGRDFQGLRTVTRFVREHYPLAWRHALLDPRVYIRGLLALVGI